MSISPVVSAAKDAFPLPAPARMRRPTEDRRAEIVAAVLRLAAGSGPAEITTARIAAELGLSQGALFKHFPNKEAIRIAAMDWVSASLLHVLETAARAAATPLEALRAVFMAHVDFIVDHPGVPCLLFHELQQPLDTPVKRRVREILKRYRTMLVGHLDAARERGEATADVDGAAAATLFIGTVQGLMMQAMLAGSARAMRHNAEPVFAIWLRGIRAPSRGAGRRAPTASAPIAPPSPRATKSAR